MPTGGRWEIKEKADQQETDAKDGGVKQNIDGKIRERILQKACPERKAVEQISRKQSRTVAEQDRAKADEDRHAALAQGKARRHPKKIGKAHPKKEIV